MKVWKRAIFSCARTGDANDGTREKRSGGCAFGGAFFFYFHPSLSWAEHDKSSCVLLVKKMIRNRNKIAFFFYDFFFLVLAPREQRRKTDTTNKEHQRRLLRPGKGTRRAEGCATAEVWRGSGTVESPEKRKHGGDVSELMNLS